MVLQSREVETRNIGSNHVVENVLCLTETSRVVQLPASGPGFSNPGWLQGLSMLEIQFQAGYTMNSHGFWTKTMLDFVCQTCLHISVSAGVMINEIWVKIILIEKEKTHVTSTSCKNISSYVTFTVNANIFGNKHTWYACM